VSTDDQHPNLQLAALKRAGYKRIFTDKASGAHVKQPQLTRCLASLQTGDALVVWKLNRLGRSLRDLTALLDDLKTRHRHNNSDRPRHVADGGDTGGT
jgi:DNA invertase Pin-like site-specific DNA recombinase